MPELPEVETIVRELISLEGKKIRDIQVFVPRFFYGRPADVVGKKIKKISRRGKLIIFKLTEGWLVMHLKMTGQLLVDRPRDKFTRAIIRLSGGTILQFNDVRRFGFVKYMRDDELNRTLLRLGPEPLGREFSFDQFRDRVMIRAGSGIKNVLLDQRVIAGIGNIYADEILYLARVHPGRRVSLIGQAKLKAIYDSIRLVLRKAILLKGSSINNYRTTRGAKGRYSDVKMVYGREGEECFRCGTKISRIKINQRSSYFCKRCQNPLKSSSL